MENEPISDLGEMEKVRQVIGEGVCSTSSIVRTQEDMQKRDHWRSMRGLNWPGNHATPWFIALLEPISQTRG